ncbi:ATP-binding protein [Pantoea alhagi]|uniref:ATP-binding protein n=1 Tax=Pantoea alhagi TaxID=1891675 RepID=UPI00202B4412|nr:ATP-binding protein [Pantoea alhagi]URQ62124.1 ATP-binding protein [Pantoea alhagi]
MSNCYLSSFAVIEPDDRFYRYHPSWLNVWESHLYNRAIKATNAQGWFFKRFGCDKALYAREMIRKPACIDYIEATEQAADQALQQLAAKERMRLMKSRTAFICVDAWGESGLFENITSALHVTMLDSLPKNLLKKFSVKEFTCKVRGEQHAFMQALRMAQDYLSWDIFDFVVISAAYRAIPPLVFSTAENTAQAENPDIKMNFSVERAGCFIFSQQESALQIACGNYLFPDSNLLTLDRLCGDADIERLAIAGLSYNLPERDSANKPGASAAEIIRLSEKYGDSGCLSPALSWLYLERHRCRSGKMRTVMPGAMGSYHYFDTRYQP